MRNGRLQAPIRLVEHPTLALALTHKDTRLPAAPAFGTYHIRQARPPMGHGRLQARTRLLIPAPPT